MNPEHQEHLEREIDRALKALPDITAPEHLLGRVLARIEVGAAKPWYQRAWSDWPAGARFSSLVLLSVAFAGLCYLFWKAPEIQFLQPLLAKLRSLAGIADAIWSVVGTFLSLLTMAFRRLGTGVLIGCAALVFLGYALFLGLGSVFFRAALVRR